MENIRNRNQASQTSPLKYELRDMKGFILSLFFKSHHSEGWFIVRPKKPFYLFFYLTLFFLPPLISYITTATGQYECRQR